MNSFRDYSVFNQINPGMIQPRERKPLPYPLENIEDDIANCYALVDTIYKKIEIAKTNPVNDTPARKKKINSLKYKLKTCLKILQDASISCSELWF
jgi:hypothetical protein